MKIFRISSILFLLIAVFAGVLLFWTSQAVQQKEAALKDARKLLLQEQETLRVLSVEWDYLNRPQRLEELAVQQLGMELPSSSEVIRSAGDIPEPMIAEGESVFEEEGMIHAVAVQAPKPAAPKPAAVAKPATISPQTAEKQSFEKLIQSLDAEGEVQ